MGSAIGLQGELDGAALRRLARGSGCASQTRRHLALAGIYDGGSRAVAARIWPGRHVLGRCPALPPGDRLRVDAVTLGARPQALLTMPNRATASLLADLCLEQFHPPGQAALAPPPASRPGQAAVDRR